MSDSRNTSRYALVLLLASALTVQVWAHGGEDHGDEKKSTPAPVAVAVNAVNAQGQVTFIEPALRLPDGSVFVPKSAQRQLALRTQAARKGEFPRSVELNGRVVGRPQCWRTRADFPERAHRGRPEGTRGTRPAGQQRTGTRLAAAGVSAIERGSQQSALAELAAQESVLERRVARLRQLEGSVPQKDIEQAQIELAAVQKAQRRGRRQPRP
jgi:cobalt-zinc-cadmium efflux system membrane fusion protein